jgi:hypothetical protein
MPTRRNLFGVAAPADQAVCRNDLKNKKNGGKGSPDRVVPPVGSSARTRFAGPEEAK